MLCANVLSMAKVARSPKIPLNPNLLLTVARMRMRKNTLRMVARTMFLQLMMTRKRKKIMPLLEPPRSRSLAI